jgi:hypothetical protein
MSRQDAPRAVAIRRMILLTYSIFERTLHYRVHGRTEDSMTDDQAREDIALIRTALDQGRAYATARSPAMMVWGLLIAAGYGGTWAFVTGRWAVRPDWLWGTLLALGWIFALRGVPGRIASGASPPLPRPLVAALRAVWFGLGIFLTLTYAAGLTIGGLEGDWMEPVAAGVLGAGFFASAPLCNLGWMRLVAVAWWVGEVAMYWLHGTAGALILGAALYLALLAGPGLVLRLRPRAP